MKETTYMYFYNFRYISSIIIGISSLCVIHVVIGAIWTVDISLGSSVVELLTIHLQGSGFDSRSSHIFSLYLYAHSSFLTTYMYTLCLNTTCCS